MTRTNLTLQLDEAVVRRARVVAAKRGTSVSALVARKLQELADGDDRYEQARIRAEALMRDATAYGGRTWACPDIYDR
jgi:Family of unknown function (DUF6364)